jgi:putative nucleotidyltransferase with HDIG domain
MAGRPSRTVVALEAAALLAAIAIALWREPHADWDHALFLTLLGFAVVADLTAVETATHQIRTSASFLVIVTAIVFLGATPAALIAVVAILGGWLRSRYPAQDLLANLVTYAWFPLLAGIGFHELVSPAGGTDTPLFYLLVFGLFLVALGINFILVAAYSSYIEDSKLTTKFRRTLLPILPSELASALLAVGIVYAYSRAGLAALALFGAALLVFQQLVGALLLSQERADELEVRAKQLAGFQIALLSALLRTLDLRDRMTARHSAAVARYARDIAAATGHSEEEQEVAHTAGLLHDIGKFILPDRILKGEGRLTEEDWDQIRKHPYEGARIVSQIDGYRPIGEVILAHHERIDGLGYPRGLRAEEIPAIARIVAVADAYSVMTARETYVQPRNHYEAVEELRRSAGTQLDGTYVEAFVEILEQADVPYRHGEDADFEAELALDRRIHDYVNAGTPPRPRMDSVFGPTRR